MTGFNTIYDNSVVVYFSGPPYTLCENYSWWTNQWRTGHFADRKFREIAFTAIIKSRVPVTRSANSCANQLTEHELSVPRIAR